MFAYPLPSIPTHFQPILIEIRSSPIGIDPTTLQTNFPSSDRRGEPKSDLLSPINEQHPHVECNVFVLPPPLNKVPMFADIRDTA